MATKKVERKTKRETFKDLYAQETRDNRDCPKCRTRMECKASLECVDEVYNSKLWQCPACKNVELL